MEINLVQTNNKNLRIVTVDELLKENLKIPEYQRPYRWSTESAVTLVTDCYAAFVNKVSEYRIGSVILHRETGKNNEIKLNIVDGQQRLTTISIMFFVFDELIKDGGYADKSKLLDEEYNELSCEAIVNNLDIIRRKVNEIDKNQLKGFVNFLLNNCTLVKIITESEQEAFQFFDSQNSRGKELAPHDLLKSYHLREMADEPETSKVEIINAWENTEQDKLKNLFCDHLYPLVRWYKQKDGLNYSTKDIKTFKGIKRNNNYNFSIYSRAANLYIEKFNTEGMYELASGKHINKFQLTQPVIAGKRFFQYSLHYVDVYEQIDKLISFNFNENQIVKSGTGDTYIYNLFVNVSMFYADRFNIESLTYPRLLFLYKWAFSLRVCMKAVYRESVNKYAQGLSDRVNYGLNMFSLISEMQSPMELDTIILDNISEEQFKNSKINVDRYRTMYDTMFRRGQNDEL